jgi:hypothetical protein
MVRFAVLLIVHAVHAIQTVTCSLTAPSPRPPRVRLPRAPRQIIRYRLVRRHEVCPGQPRDESTMEHVQSV